VLYLILRMVCLSFFFFFQAEDGIRDWSVTGVQTCALPISVYLAADKTSPYAFYQYWINIADADAGTCLRFLTELSHAEIESLDKSRAEQPHLRESQKRLADDLTRQIHGELGLGVAKKATDVFFGAEIENLSD